jgi:hypothetical protein
MGWDRKKRGPASGYFYKSVRVPGKLHPVKIYFGRKGAGLWAAAAVSVRRRERQGARDAVRAERARTADAERLAEDLREWAEVLSAAWLVLTGHHRHHGEWRLRGG